MRVLADLSELVDLFPGQQLTVQNQQMAQMVLTGPDFTIDIEPHAADATSIAARLNVPGIPALAALVPALTATLNVRQQGEDYILEGLDKVSGTIDALTILAHLKIEQAAATLSLGLEPWRLTIADPQGAAIGRLQAIDIVFDIQRLVLDATGVVECRATLDPGGCTINGLGLEVSEGSLALRGSRVEARVQGTLAMPYFSNAAVALQLVVTGDLQTGQWSAAGQTHLATNQPWRDPSGLLSFDRMAVTVELAPQDAGFVPSLRIGGRVTFLPHSVPEVLGRWFEGLFDGLAVSFENVPLQGDGGSPRFTVVPTDSLRLRALSVFELRVAALRFDEGSVTLGNCTLHAEAGGALISGTVGDLRIGLGELPVLSLAWPADVALQIAAPGGFKAQARLADKSTEKVQVLTGSGSLSSPALAAVSGSFTIGRWREGTSDWRLVLSVVVAEDNVNIPLFPGVVITRIELGVGINRSVADVTHLSLLEARQQVQKGLPDIFDQSSWTESKADLTVVARIVVEPTKTIDDRAMSLYVADMTLLMTSDFQFAAFGWLWFYTTRADARTPEFQRKPSAQGLALFDGQQPSLRLVAMTREDGLSSLEKQYGIGRAGALLAMRVPRTQVAFEASPAGMTLVVGPVEVGTELGPLRVAGSTLFALRSAAGRVYAISHSTLAARFGASAAATVGPATLRGSLVADFSATLSLLGSFESGTLTIYGAAHASFHVALELDVRIGFEIRISVGFGSVTISWHEDWHFSLRVHVDLDLQVALDSTGAIGVEGRASLGVEVLGISASLALHIEDGTAVLARGRQVYEAASAEVSKLTGGN